LKIKSWQIYSLLIAAAGTAYFIYQNDSTPPVVSNFEVSGTEFDTTKNSQQFSFSGTITDDRDLQEADLICMQDGVKRMIIHLGVKGSSTNLASFGILPGSPSWIGSWTGSLTNLKFQGTALLPKGMKNTDCIFEARLKDAIGNQNNDSLNVKMTVIGK
jgi:hypothetical protein